MGLLFTVSVGMPCCGLREYEPLTINFFLLIVSRRNWKGPWTIPVIYWGHKSVRDFKLRCKLEWYKNGPVQMEGNLRQV